MSVEVTKLPTGLTVVTDTMPHLETAALGVWAGVGGRDRVRNRGHAVKLDDHEGVYPPDLQIDFYTSSRAAACKNKPGLQAGVSPVTFGRIAFAQWGSDHRLASARGRVSLAVDRLREGIRI